MASTDSQHPEQGVEDSLAKRPAKAPTGVPLYLRWLSWLCAFMALFCVGVFLVGYKDPSIGRIATLVALIAASGILWWLSKKKAR